MLDKIFNKINSNKKEICIIVLLLFISGISHSYNMFHFPYYENDEGTYMSQAWSILTQGKLAPYTYWYDHAPAGWMLIALWAKLTGGFFTFGSSVNSGRVLMLLLHLGTTTMAFYVAKKISKSYLAGILTVILFSLSPLGIYFQRRVLLDNIMIFWVFLSLILLLKKKLKLRHVALSAIFFGIAVLTKENAIFFTPAFLYVLISESHKSHKIIAIVQWVTISFLIISNYLLYAILKGEFFPVGFLGNNIEHVSLLTTLSEQVGRGNNYPFWSKKSDFYFNLIEWIQKDQLIILLGVFSTVVGALLSLKEKALRIPTLFTTLFWFFLMRGKLVIDFYIVPLIPLLALNIGILFNYLSKRVSLNKIYLYRFINISLLLFILSYQIFNSTEQFTKDETKPYTNAINWIKLNIPENSHIIIDNSIYVDLHASRFDGDKVLSNADWAWKVEKDSEIKLKIYNNDWKNIEYIALTHEILKKIKDDNFNLIQKAFDNSKPEKEWYDKSTSYINLKKYESTNGDWMAIYKLKDNNLIVLDNSWNFFKNNYIKSYGQIVDPNDNFKTTSEGQSYALLRAVYQDDKDTFNGVWSWTKDHLQYRKQDRLFSWLWIRNGNKYILGDSASASDADEDIALALLFAYQKWGDIKYLEDAKEVITDVWKKEVKYINGKYYLVSGSDASRPDGYLLNPSYLSPASYRIFSTVDNIHPWEELANDSYYLLNQVGYLNNTHLPNNWILIDVKDGTIKPASKYINDKDIQNYGFDAFRVMWRVSLDATWFNNSEAKSYLEKIAIFYEKEWLENKKFSSIYETDGTEINSDQSLSTSVGALLVLSATNTDLANDIYKELFEINFNFSEGYWGDKNNYFDQNWAWLGTAFYTSNLPNLWISESQIN